MQNAEQLNMTAVRCRYCGRKTFTSVRYGDVSIFCNKCKKTFRVRIEGERTADLEKEKN